MGIRDSRELACRTGWARAGFDRDARTTGRGGGPRPTSTSRPARSGPWLHAQGVRFFPVVGWAERGGYLADGPRQLGAALPHHLGHRARAWSRRSSGGCARRVAAGLVELRFRHRVDELTVHRRRRSTASRARCWSPATSSAARPARASRSGDFELRAQAVIVTSGGIGGNHDLVRAQLAGAARRRRRSGCSPACPRTSTAGCSASPSAAGGRIINRDRMWHYTEGIQNWNPIWAGTASASCPARRRCGSTRRGKRLPVPLFPGFDTLGTLEHIMTTGYDYTWFVLTQKIIEKEFALSGLRAEPGPDRQGRPAACSAGRAPGAPAPVRGVQGPRRRLRRRATTCPSWCAG